MENKNKNKKSKLKKLTKEKIFKIVHLFTYILSALFIIICIAVGVNSCKAGNNKQSNKPTQQLIDNGNYSLTLSTDEFSSTEFLTWLISKYAPTTWDNKYTSVNVDLYFTLNDKFVDSLLHASYIRGVKAYANDNTSHYEIVFQKVYGTSYGSSASTWDRFQIYSYLEPISFGTCWYFKYSNNYGLLPTSVTFNDLSSTDYDYIKSLFSSSGGYTEEELEEMTSEAYDSGYNEGYSEGYNEGYSEGNEEGYSIGFNSGYQYAENIYNTDLDEIVINYDYDFRSLVCTNIDNKTGAMYSNTAYPQGQGAVINDLEGLTFMCNSQTYNFVRIAYMPLDRDDALFFEDDISVRTAYQLFGEQFIYYAKLLNVYYGFKDSEGTITQIDNAYNGITFQRGYDSNTLDVLGQDLRNPKFLNNSFRYLKIIQDTGELVSVKAYGNNYTLAQILSFDGQINTMNENTTNVFSLFSMAFGSMSGLLSIAILPNISLGLLMFIPLIVGIVVLILKALKK